MGVASLNIGFGGEAEGGSYHSIFDSIDHYTRFGDPTFEYGIALAKVGGRTVLRLANADLLPFDARGPGGDGRLVRPRGAEAGRRPAGQDGGGEPERSGRGCTSSRTTPPSRWWRPGRRTPFPTSASRPSRTRWRGFRSSAAAFQKAGALESLSPAARSARNAAFIGLERKLTRPEGLPGRPWFTHQVYAPGFYTGYGVKTLPAIREALEQRQWAQATQQIENVARTLDAFSAELERLSTP